ncbi:alpha/beta fold hydrolase [Aliterella atlantica]|uniref:AB hydrolase-1 domain-containing protein n=1 Tax=Aliterella atlantica CENA595 TaxID=1618023 RepID=A0A0D8ZVZ2_9CYAN|nr:alpha/beta fold hydrolase [Aliterella atlantica]KJH72915.1 hypothetical protein UH38_05115 [Aliterella atlantica CENA595]
MIQTPADQFIRVNGINTRYWQVGNQGTSVLFVHGAGASIDYWYKNVFELAQNHRVYALDLVGSGKSDKPDTTYTYDDLAQFVIEFVDAVGLSQLSLVATSGGGAIALKLTSAYPDRVQKLVLANCAGLGKSVGFGMRVSAIPGVGEALNKPSIATAKFLIHQCFYAPQLFLTDEVIDLVYRNIPVEVLKFQLRTFRTAANFLGMKSAFLSSIRECLSKIHCPTLVLWGKQDRVIPVKYAQVAVQAIPNAKLQLFDECGHLIYIECSDAFNKQVLAFLGE